ncbi:hypothetical protein DL96DRAFT_1573614 [Flagelloscypha sp. PMI_526]|nr:hypothetical protein DL96DRAFT_1573614 [Flagelloscypha sp. PMI_526]
MNEYGRRDTLRPFSQYTDDTSVYSPSVYPTSRQNGWAPDASMLELSDDSRSSSLSYDEDNNDDIGEEHGISQMSMGPKMRFHSPAPWEDESVADEDFPEPVRKKPFSFASSYSDSFRIKQSRKQSDGEKPRSGLHSLVQIGHNLQRAASPPHSLSIPSSRFQTPHHPSSPVASLVQYPPSSPSNSEYSSIHRGRDSDSDSSDPVPGGHPFANPDLAYRPQESVPLPSPARSTFSAMHPFPRSDSSATMTTTLNGSMPATPPHHRDYDKAPSVRKWDISGPLPTQQSSLNTSVIDTSDPRVLALMPRGNPNDFTSFPDRSGPGFQLISLEEAREQRKRSQTADTASVISGTTGGDSQSISDFNSSRGRARSVSAGAKAKGALQSMVNTITPTPLPLERRDSEPGANSTGKTLKHKKSGFMRMFGKEKDAPPVPSLADTYSAMNSNNPAVKPIISKPTKAPVPHLSGGFPDPSLDDLKLDSPSSGSTTRHSPSPSRKAPLLALQIPASSPSSKPFSQSAFLQTQTLPVGASEGYDRGPAPLPQSAPANVLQFPALRLRPVSTTFSSKFGEEFISRDSQPSLDTDLSTTSSPTSANSPITPGISSRSILSDKEKAGFSSSSKPTEDQSAIIQSLQEQIVSAKKSWQRHIWELEGQVRDLKAEVEDLRGLNKDSDCCQLCGRGGAPKSAISSGGGSTTTPSVVNRPRARTGISSSRFGGIV